MGIRTRTWDEAAQPAPPIEISLEVDYAATAEISLPNPTLVSDVTAITQANPGQVTTAAPHGFTTARIVRFIGVGGMTQLNNEDFIVTVINTTTFTIGVNTTGYGAYTSGGTVYRLPRFDGADAFDGCSVLLPLQAHDEVENGVYIWTEVDNTMTRHPEMDTGMTITSPYYIAVRDEPIDSEGLPVAPGDDYAGAVFELQETTFVVGTDPNNWSVAVGAGVYGPNYVLAGPGLPSARPNISRPRVMYGADLPQMGVTGADSGYFKQSVPELLTRVPRISSYVRHQEPWADHTSFEYLQKFHKEFVVDCMLQFRSSPAFYSGRRIIFDGTGFGGSVRILSLHQNVKVFDVSGTTDLWLDGHMVFEELIPHSAVTPGIYANASFTNLRLGKVWSKGMSHAVYFDTAHSGFNIEEVNVNDPVTEVGFASLNASGSRYSTLLRNLAVPQFQTIATDAAATIKAEADSDIIEHTGTLTAARTLTLSTENVTRNKRMIIKRTGTGAFNLNIGAIATLATNKMCEIGWDGVAGAWKLIGKGDAA